MYINQNNYRYVKKKKHIYICKINIYIYIYNLKKVNPILMLKLVLNYFVLINGMKVKCFKVQNIIIYISKLILKQKYKLTHQVILTVQLVD